MDIERVLLVKTVQEINEHLGLVPAIDDNMPDDTLVAVIRKVCPLIEAKDDFSNEVLATLVLFDTLSDDVSTVFDMKLSYDQTPEPVEPDTTKIKKSSVPSTQKDTPAKNRKRKPHIIRIEELIAEGKYTSAQIAQIILSEFKNLKKDTINNYIRGSRHEKYTLFAYTVIEDINGVLRFDKMK